MTALVMFVLGVLLLLGLAAGLRSGRRDTGSTYTGETINRLIATVDRVFRRRRLP
jgi:hypothetical protein